MEDGYPRHPRATVNRLKSRGLYDYDSIHQIIDSTPLLHVSFPPIGDDPFPINLPMLGCTGVFDEEMEASRKDESENNTPGAFPTGDEKQEPEFPPGPRSIYLHGHAAARLFRAPESDGRLPVTIAASSIQGIVLALAPFHNSCNYTSAVIQGYASSVTSEAERIYALTRITDNLVPTRWDNSRNPPTKAEMTSTGVLRVDIESASAKFRTGEPGDDRADLKNDELTSRVWTGVIPCWTQYGEPVPSSYNKAKRLPGYLSSFVKDENSTGEMTAKEAIAKPAPK